MHEINVLYIICPCPESFRDGTFLSREKYMNKHLPGYAQQTTADKIEEHGRHFNLPGKALYTPGYLFPYNFFS